MLSNLYSSMYLLLNSHTVLLYSRFCGSALRGFLKFALVWNFLVFSMSSHARASTGSLSNQRSTSGSRQEADDFDFLLEDVVGICRMSIYTFYLVSMFNRLHFHL